MFQQRVHTQHRVVRLDAGRGDLRARPHREGDLRLLAVVNGEALQEQAAETRPSAAAARATGLTSGLGCASRPAHELASLACARRRLPMQQGFTEVQGERALLRTAGL